MLSNLNSSTTFSIDFYVRMREHELVTLDLKHSFSEVTSPRGSPLEGYTEWVGCFKDKLVSLSWSWTILSDSYVQMIKSPPPTVNIMLIDERGYDIGPAGTTEKCGEKIGTLQWTLHIFRLQEVG